MSERKPLLGIAFVISEPIQAEGLPILEVYRTDDGYVLGQGTELVVSALKKSISNLGTSNHTVLFLAIDVRTAQERTSGGAE